MTTEPEQLRREIERTQRGLRTDVDALTEKVTPSRIVHRRVDRARHALTSARDTIMGTASETTDRIGSTASTVTDNIASAASSAGEAVSDAPRQVRRQTQGNPLAAGLIAFGLGWLTASLLPPSRREQEIAEQAKDLAQEHVQPAVTEMAGELKDNLREPAEQAVESIKSTAQNAGATVTDEARSAAEDVKDRAREATGNDRGQANSGRHSS
jgi:ElaB/YqjD/DUF883 family membrane-anchored ribosome-binding protein